MYWLITQVKKKAIFSIAIMVLLHGCATEQFSPFPVKSQSYNTEIDSSHIVQTGETLGSIAKYYGVNYKTIAVLNGLSSPYTIYPGQRLTISNYGSTTPEYGGSQSIPVDLPSTPQSQPLKSYNPSRYRPTTRNTSSSSNNGVHIVQRGDTLYSIARRYGKNVRQVAAWNNISSPYTLDVGQRLHVNASSSVSIPTPKPRTPSFSSPRGNTTSHTVQSGQTLSDVAQLYGYSLQEVARWNGIAPPYNIYAGRRLRVTPYPSNSPSSSFVGNNSVSYTVQPGETLSDIAQRYGYSVTELANWNGIAPPYSLSVGRKLRVAPWTIPQTTSTTTTQTTKTTNRSATSHTVARGDTLYSIARYYGINVGDIARWNNLQPPYTLSVGQSLQLASSGPQKKIVPKKTSVPKSQATQTYPRHNNGYHTVARGESLYNIATGYGYSVAQIAAWNNLRVPYRLSVGQTLRVYPRSGAKLGSYKNYSTRQTNSSRALTSKSSGSYHTVARGDTIYNIARRYGNTPANIMTLNNLQPPYHLSIGQRLRVSSSAIKSQKTSSRQKSSNRKHIVKSGDTLMSIANQYGVSAYNLSEWNGIGPPYALYPGQQIWLVKPR